MTCTLAAILTAGFCILGCAAAPTGEAPQPAEQTVGELHNVVRVADWLWSGAQPEGAADFESLAKLGVKTIISVDSATPDITGATAQGIRYVHIPFGYDGIPDHARAQLARATAECDRPIYIHCHHGRHRGPAGAAIIYRCDTNCAAEDAAEIMRVAGTGDDYAGLWKDVREFDPTDAAKESTPLVEHADVPDIAARMAEIDRAWDRFLPGKENVTVEQLRADALIIEEGLKETLRFLDEEADSDLRSRLEQAVSHATEMREGVANDRVIELKRRVAADCKTCHKAHRN